MRVFYYALATLRFARTSVSYVFVICLSASTCPKSFLRASECERAERKKERVCEVFVKSVIWRADFRLSVCVCVCVCVCLYACMYGCMYACVLDIKDS